MAGTLPIVPATESRWLSRRRLPQASYTGRCPRCGAYRMYRAPGERVCPCGQRVRLVVTAVVGVIEAVTG